MTSQLEVSPGRWLRLRPGATSLCLARPGRAADRCLGRGGIWGEPWRRWEEPGIFNNFDGISLKCSMDWFKGNLQERFSQENQSIEMWRICHEDLGLFDGCHRCVSSNGMPKSSKMGCFRWEKPMVNWVPYPNFRQTI